MKDNELKLIYEYMGWAVKTLKVGSVTHYPFSGNGQNICRKYELGNCPTEDKIKELIRLRRLHDRP